MFLIFDFSPGRIWLYASLLASAGNLAGRNIHISPFDPWGCEFVKTHNSFWNDYNLPHLLPWHIEDQFKKIAADLGAGKDVLLFAQPMRITQHEVFWAALTRFIDASAFEARVIFIVGAPGVALENYWREFYSVLQFDPGAIASEIKSLPQLAEYYFNKLGRDKCNIFVNNHSRAFEPPPAELLAQIAQILQGCEVRTSVVPRHPLVFRSHNVRRIWRALEVRENAWPSLPANEVFDLLLKLDAGEPEGFLSSQTEREALGDEAIQKSFGEICGVQIDVPETGVSRADLNGRLPAPLLAKFAESLPEAARMALCSRLLNDRHLLVADQEDLLDALVKASGQSDWQRVEVTSEPVALTVLTMTYNQEKYIRKCLDSVLAQQTNFPVRHLVLDHCSADGTAQIVADYASRYPSIRPVLLSSRRYAENTRGLHVRCRTPYAIVCDGDDYFIDPLKLQHQVDYLEQHPDMAFCFHPVIAVYEDGSPPAIFPPMRMIPGNMKESFELADLVDGNFIQSNSVLYRWRFQDGLPEWFRPDICLGDWYMHMLHAEKGNFGFLPRIMSAYRRHSGALFAASSVSSVEVRRFAGIAELETIRACIAHFDKRFQPNFIALAQRVLNDLGRLSDHSLLDYALKKYPEFAI